MDTGNNQCCFSSKEAGTEFGHSVRRVRNHEEHVVGAVDNLNNFAHTDGSTFHEESSAMDKKEGRITKGMQVQLDIEREKRCIAEMKVHHGQNEQQEIMDEEDGQEPLGDDELRENEALEQLREGDWHLPQSTLHSQGIHQQHQSQPPGPVIRWERFLPQRCLRVLLVENDDCTRQVVSALLRNCSYEVVAVANGQQAWQLLEDPSNHFDLILTEVVMPNLSGIGLLSKIMSHSTCKNIPVIMMSSHDSMGVVFKCLSKGAVDFLVKPVRKNELKNLWQHVWRRCHSVIYSVAQLFV